ncbi:MAG: A24 family peptidase [Acidobacteriaceae bacterium]|jgi:prepilin peptidase CpaA
MDIPDQQLMFLGGSLLCAGIGSVTDVRERRIPNYVTGTAAVAGLMLHAIFGGWRGLGDSALAGVIAGGIFLIFYLAGGMGAGDVKLMAAVGCFAGLHELALVVISTAIAGGVFALAVSIYHGRLHETLRNVVNLLQHHGRQGLKAHPDLNLSNARTVRLPFALPIAAGCLYTLCTLAWEARP